MTKGEVLAVATQAQTAWGGIGAPKLIGHRENAVFRIETPDGPLALRLHRVGYQSHDHIMGEMVWTEHLATHGFPCPRPVRTRDGALILNLPNGQMVTAVCWIDADPIGEFECSESEREQLFFDLGALLLRLHRETDQMTIKVARPTWMADDFLGDTPAWGRFWDNPSLSVDEVSLVLDARARAIKYFGGLTDFATGLIHADALPENVLGQNPMHLIDFDDSGHGYRLYDLAVPLVRYEGTAQLASLTTAICEGYGAGANHIPFFMMLRSMASAGWIISRADANAPAQRVYAERMLRLIRWVDKTA